MSDSHLNDFANTGYAQGYKDGERKGRADAIEEFYNRLSRNKGAMNTAHSPWDYVEVAYREMNGIV